MVQNVSTNSQNNLGSITRIGNTNNGRVVYQVTDNTGTVAGKMSVAQKDCAVFEKAYKDMIEAAPKLQEFAKKTSPEEMYKKQKRTKWIIGGCGLLGGIWPLLKCKGEGWIGLLKQVGLTTLGTAAGLLAGIFIASKTMTPPGAAKFSKATQTISKLDIQPVQE